MKEIKAIIVEDELFAAEYLKEILEKHGIEVLDIIDRGEEAIRICVEKKPDIVLMDIMLADHISGSEAALTISGRIDTKIIFLTAYMDEESVDYAVEAKAAGYLSKPYNEAEIIATIRLATEQYRPSKPAAEEHTTPPPQPDIIHLAGGYTFFTDEKRLLKEGKDIELGPKARKLLDLLCQTPGKLVSNEQISMHIWGELVNDKTLRSLIYRLRSLTSEELVSNVSGLGYMVERE